MKIKQYLFNNLVAIDQLVNTLTAGYPDETLSARAYRRHFTNKKWVIIMHIINALFFNNFLCFVHIMADRMCYAMSMTKERKA